MNKQRRTYTDLERATVRRLYPDHQTSEVAEMLGLSVDVIYYLVEKMGIHKSEAFIEARKALDGERLKTVGAGTRFHAGQVAWNFGKPHPSKGRTNETQFKPLNVPHNWQPIGATRVTKDGYLQRKVSDTGYTPRDYVSVHRLLWIEEGREIPPGHLLIFRDGNKRNVALENLELITLKENMRRNTVHNYGSEIAQLTQLRGALIRIVNRKSKTT